MAIGQESSESVGGSEQRQLRRALTSVTNGALTFAAVGVFGGLFSLYGFSINAVGPVEFWGWPLLVISVGMMVLVFAELASQYPFAGSMYQWPTILAGRRVGWWVGWAYGAALIPLMTAYYATLTTLVDPLFGIASNAHNNTTIIFVAAVIAVLWNIGSVGILGKLAEWIMLLELTVVTVIIAVVFILGGKHFGVLTSAATTVTNASGESAVHAVSSFGAFLPLFLGAGIFNAVWVLYTFENGGTLGEETIDGSRNAPRGIIGAFLFVVGCGFVWFLGLTTSIPDIHQAMVNYNPAESAITAHLPEAVLKIFLATIALGIIAATNTMFMGAVRHIFGMARGQQLPFARTFSKTSTNGAPWPAVILLGVLSVIPALVFGTKTASIVGGATGAMYLVYFVVMVVVLVARLRGWPRRKAHFALGRFGMLVNVLAVAGTGLTFVNLEWPRAATNPTYNQIGGTTGGMFWRDLPMGWLLIVVPLVIGAAFYAARWRTIHNQPSPLDKYAEQG